VQFSQAAYSIGEDGREAVITVTRTGDLSTSASVEYATEADASAVDCRTVSGRASERCDFATARGALTFPAGDGSPRTFAVPIVDDAHVEGTEAFQLTLSNANNATLGGQSVATLTIADNDTNSQAANPLDDNSFFVRQQYRDFLNREADAPGFAFWMQTLQGYLDQCRAGDVLTCRARAKAAVSEAFFVSVEFQQTGYLVYRLYKTAYPESPARPRGLPRYAEFLRDAQQIGSGVVVGSPGWEQKLEANKQQYFREFVQRPEFTSSYPESLSAEQYVAALLTTAGLPQAGVERQDALVAYGAGGIEGRAKALLSIAESKRLFLLEFNKAFVLMQYFGYLRRNADEGEDASRPFSGYDFWLGKLNAESGDTTRFNTINELLAPTKRAQMVEAFVVTGEYRRRFGPE